jgi:cobalt-zinc-cadmium efflux system membrane fusion protein
MVIEVDENLRRRLRIGEPTWAAVGPAITVAARVEVDETRVTRVGSPVMGRIGSLLVREGEQVRKGQTLALLNSVGLSEAQLSFLKALSQKQLASRAVERARLLLKADVIGTAELQRREADLAQASAELAAARDELTLLGMPQESIQELERTRTIHSTVPIVATSDGTVLERHVTPGQVVQPAETVFEVADLSHVWLVADVPEQIAGNIVEGMAVDAQVAALPGENLSGRLTFVSATVNPDTRTVRVRMEVPNRQRRLKPAMLATMVLRDHAEPQRVIPSEAVVREDNVEHLFVQLESNTFILRPVALGPDYGGRRVLLDGVRDGEKIVVSGAFHLNNERRRRAVRGSDGD